MTTNNTHNPFDELVLGPEETIIESALENGEFEESSELEDTKSMLRDAAQLHHQLNTTKPITLRINQLDLIKIKARAKRNNIPYQTLLGAVLHDFAEKKDKIEIK